MKCSIVSGVILYTISALSFAGSFDNAAQKAADANNALNSAQALSLKADEQRQSALDHFNGASRYNADGSLNKTISDKLDHTFSADKQAHANEAKATSQFSEAVGSPNLSGSAMRAQIQQQQQQAIHDAQVANYGVKSDPNLPSQLNNYGAKGNPNLVAQVNPSISTSIIRAIPQRPATIVASVPGYVVSKHPPFAGESWGNTRGANNGDHGRSGTGNGSNNAANSHSAHGLGGGDHIGGGRSGGGYHY